MARWRNRSGRVAVQAATMQWSGGMSNLSESIRISHDNALTPISRLLVTFRIWIARRQQRKALGDMAECSPHLLKDIGVSGEEARREAAKWLWQA